MLTLRVQQLQLPTRGVSCSWKRTTGVQGPTVQQLHRWCRHNSRQVCGASVSEQEPCLHQQPHQQQQCQQQDHHQQQHQQARRSSVAAAVVAAAAVATCASLASPQTAHAAAAAATAAAAVPLALVADLDAASAHSIESVLRPLFAGFTVLYIIRIPMTWYPSIDGTKLPWLLAYAPTEPFLRATRAVIPSVGGVDVTPIVWVGLISFFNEILLGPQGILMLIQRESGAGLLQ